MVLRQLAEERGVVENQYRRIVPEAGNRSGLAAISRVFELPEFFEWRGLGSIDHSGVRVRGAYARYDAERKFSLPGLKIADPKACQGCRAAAPRV
jgi:hydrogenase expression/formation protein HypD